MKKDQQEEEVMVSSEGDQQKGHRKRKNMKAEGESEAKEYTRSRTK